MTKSKAIQRCPSNVRLAVAKKKKTKKKNQFVQKRGTTATTPGRAIKPFPGQERTRQEGFLQSSNTVLAELEHSRNASRSAGLPLGYQANIRRRALGAGKLPANGFYLRNKEREKGDGSVRRSVTVAGRAPLLIARAANKGQQKRTPANVRRKRTQGLAEQ